MWIRRWKIRITSRDLPPVSESHVFVPRIRHMYQIISALLTALTILLFFVPIRIDGRLMNCYFIVFPDFYDSVNAQY